MTTFAELQIQAQTLPNRITAAVMDGDAQALGALEQERATLPALLLAAELRELQATIAETETALLASKATADDARAAALAAERAAWDAQLAHQAAMRKAGIIAQERGELRDQLRAAKLRMEQIAAEQAYIARAAAAPVQRSLTNVPGPVRWPA